MNPALAAGLIILALAWGGPLPGLVAESFTAHMVLHMVVVGVAVPLLALGLAARWRPGAGRASWAVVISLIDLIVVWGWHAPAPHEAARGSALALAAEQGSFFAVSLAVWLLALGGREAGEDLAGAMALFFTSMHMTLLGALLALTPRDLYHGLGGHGAHAVIDQQVGGAIMLAIGGVIYLGGALLLVGRLLRARVAP